MKTVKYILTALIAVISYTFSFAQHHDHSQKTTTKTETFDVYGNCGMCKSTIEKAATVEGVSKAEWDIKTKKLTLVYDPSLVTSDAVLKKIAAAGYDNAKYKAEDKAYNNLHACCKYDR